MDRFQYEKAREGLDAFASSPKVEGHAVFQRAYRKFLGVIAVYAFVDFRGEARDRKQALAWAWEDASMAFRGYGEACLTGAIIQMWSAIDDSKSLEKAFKKAVEEAFESADAATPKKVPRRYLKKHRKKPVRTLEEGFHLPSVLPCWGPTLREWAASEGKDSDTIEEQFLWLELADRDLATEEVEKIAEETIRPAKGGLVLIDGGKERDTE